MLASRPSDPKPIFGKVDSNGRLIAADPELDRLQAEAGSRIGATLALPQLAAVARMASRLHIPVSRRILAAGKEQDVDMWVRAVPEGNEVALTIERWIARSAPGPRLGTIDSVEHERLEPEPLSWSVDEHLRILTIAGRLAEIAAADASNFEGQPLTKIFRLEESEEGGMPLIDALASRSGFSGQRVGLRSNETKLVLDGDAVIGPAGDFAGFEGSATLVDAGASESRPVLDSAIQTALRSPLDSIVRSAEEMIGQSEAPVRQEYAAYATDIATAAKHLLSVIRSLAEHADNSGANQVDLAALTSEAVGLVETAARERSIIIGVEPADMLLARGEPRSVIQVLVNLIGNAVRHSPPQTAVTVSFENSGGSARVHVADEGPGIAPEHQNRIFEPYETAAPEGEGSGLGLAISRRLARSMGGDIELESAPGDGSRFTLVLPAA
jgi:two-component sensor histidine kinase